MKRHNFKISSLNYNKNNSSNYQEKQNALNNWNTTGENFISKENFNFEKKKAEI